MYMEFDFFMGGKGHQLRVPDGVTATPLGDNLTGTVALSFRCKGELSFDRVRGLLSTRSLDGVAHRFISFGISIPYPSIRFVPSLVEKFGREVRSVAFGHPQSLSGIERATMVLELVTDPSGDYILLQVTDLPVSQDRLAFVLKEFCSWLSDHFVEQLSLFVRFADAQSLTASLSNSPLPPQLGAQLNQVMDDLFEEVRKVNWFRGLHYAYKEAAALHVEV